MTDFNKLLAADELMNEIRDYQRPDSMTIGLDMAHDDNVDATVYTLLIRRTPRPGFIEFVRDSANYMMGTNPIMFYLRLPFAWFRFDRLQRRDHGKS